MSTVEKKRINLFEESTETDDTKVAIYHHLGMGDCIECNGMVRAYANLYKEVYVFCKENYYDIIKWMYRDNPKIKLIKVNKNDEKPEIIEFLKYFTGRIIIPGHGFYDQRKKEFDERGMGYGEAFYDLAGLDWQARNAFFHVQRDPKEEERVYNKLNPDDEDYIFVHDDPSRGYTINVNTKYKIIKNDITENPFYFLKILEKAKEIHCMSSSFLCLIDCIHLSVYFPKLYMHYNIRKVKLTKNSLVANWEII